MIIFAGEGIDESEYNNIAFKKEKFIFKQIVKDIYNNDYNYIYSHACFGHELHVTRIIIFDMLNKNIIDKDSTIICTNERQFLFNAIFEKVINIETFFKQQLFLNLNKDNFLFMPSIVFEILHLGKSNHANLIHFNYDIHNNDYWNKEMIDKILCLKPYKTIETIQNITKNNFVLFVIRSHSKVNNVDYKICLNKIKEKFIGYKILVYSQTILFDYNVDCVIQNMQDYLYCLQHENCFYIIGETSGGLELSYYYHGKNATLLEFGGNYGFGQFPNRQTKIDVGYADFYKEESVHNNFTKSIMAVWNNKFIYPFKCHYLKFDELLEVASL